MDIDNLIDRLTECSTYGFKQEICGEAANALSTLQAENEKLKCALTEMWFAYKNKDGAVPHDFEEKAVAMAQEILGPWGECMPKYL